MKNVYVDFKEKFFNEDVNYDNVLIYTSNIKRLVCNNVKEVKIESNSITIYYKSKPTSKYVNTIAFQLNNINNMVIN